MSMLEDFLEEIQAEQYIQKQLLPKIKKLIQEYGILKIRVEVDSEKEDISKLFVFIEPEMAAQLTLLQKDEDEGKFEYLLYYHYSTKQYVYVQIFQKSLSIRAYIYIIPESLIQ